VRTSSRIGYTLVEIIVALLVFTVGALALAASSAVIARTMEANALRERAARVAASRVELVKSECATAVSGAEMREQIESHWIVGRTANAVSILVSTRYSSASGSHLDRYEALALCTR
jgi:Tfp pilus assembly protein PilV